MSHVPCPMSMSRGIGALGATLFDAALGAVVEILGCETRKWNQTDPLLPSEEAACKNIEPFFGFGLNCLNIPKGKVQIIKHQLVDHQKLQNMAKYGKMTHESQQLW